MKKNLFTNKWNIILALVFVTANFAQAQNFEDKTIDAIVPTPVNLISFTATKANNDIVVSWKTASEFNNSHFVVERSNNGINFNSIGQVAGSGNSNIIKTYSFSDINTPKVNLFYRLQQVDFNGTNAYSQTVLVKANRSQSPAISIFPNPVTQFNTNISTTNLPTEKYSVSIKSLDGKNVYFTMENTIADNQPFQLQIPESIQAGIYLLQIANRNNTINVTQKLILQ